MWLFDVSYGFKDLGSRTGDHVNHGDERSGIPVSSRPSASRLKQTIQTFHTGIGVCQTEALISPVLSIDMMEKHLQQISDATPSGRHAIVVMDCASWHSRKLMAGFDNLSIIHLPPYSPELNPIEQVWAWLRNNDLANFAFKNYNDIVDQVNRGWNNFRHQVDQVKSLCKRDWANLIRN